MGERRDSLSRNARIIADDLRSLHRPGAVFVAESDEHGSFSAIAERSQTVRLIFCLSGNHDLYLCQAGRRVLRPILPGAVLLAPPGHPIEAGPHPATSCNILVDDHVLLVRHRPRPEGIALTVACTGPAIRPVVALARSATTLAADGPSDPLLCDLVDVLRRTVLRLIENPSAMTPTRAQGAFASACQVMTEDLSAEHSRTSVAAAVGVHPNHLSRVFRQEAGTGFAVWLAERRLERARRLIREGVCTIGEAGRLVGFPSASRFAQVCRRLTGRSPRDLAG